jgi:8-oxo-dGTP diphosphatase
MLQVAVGVLGNAAGDVLVAQRPAGKALAGAWEFPGGKLAAGETPLAALVRELHEELAIEVQLARFLMSYAHGSGAAAVRLYIWRVLAWAGEPRGSEGQPLRWQPVAELLAAGLLSADAPIVAALQAATPVNQLAIEPCWGCGGAAVGDASKP